MYLHMHLSMGPPKPNGLCKGQCIYFLLSENVLRSTKKKILRNPYGACKIDGRREDAVWMVVWQNGYHICSYGHHRTTLPYSRTDMHDHQCACLPLPPVSSLPSSPMEQCIPVNDKRSLKQTCTSLSLTLWL
jgi:hypothetical protein